MIKRKNRYNLARVSEKTYYKGKKHILVHKTKDTVGFTNLKTGDVWRFKKMRDGASPTFLKDQQISFGLPLMSQVCYPGQTIRISTGWNADSLPKDQMMMTYPSNNLLGADVVGLTQLYGQLVTGSELTTVLLNSGTEPIMFEVNPVKGILKVYRFNEEGLLTKDLSDVNWGQLATAALTAAVHLLPIFI